MLKKSNLVLVLIFAVGMYFLFSAFTDYYRSLPFEFKNHFTAVSLGIVGIGLHFVKKHKAVKKAHQLMFESLELVMLVFTPIFVGYEILQNFAPDKPIYKILISIAGAIFWFLATMFELAKPENTHAGKATLILSSWMYGGIISFCILAIWLIIQLDAIPK